MFTMRRLFLRLRNLLRPERGESELAREIASHLALLEDEHRRRGLSDEAARLAARKAMGSVALTKDLHRDARSFMWLDDARQDLRFAARMLVRSPGFAAVAVVTMALSIGATTTLFSLAYGVLMRPLPWPEPDRLVRLQETRGGQVARIPWTISNGTYLAWREQPATIEEIGGWMRGRLMTLTSSGERERFLVGSVTPSLMRVLRVAPLLGRAFLDSDLGAGQPNVTVLGFELWQRRFGGRPEIIGQLVRLDDQPYTVVGVMPRDFAFPDRETQAWTRLTVAPVQPATNVISLMVFSAMARLRPGATVEQASAEATNRALGAPYPMQAAVALFRNNGAPALTALPAREVMTAEVRPALLILLAAVVLLFLASTASLVVLQLSRVARRARNRRPHGDWCEIATPGSSMDRGELPALPFVTAGGYHGMSMALPRDPSTKVDVQAVMRVVSPEYSHAMRLRVLQGRPVRSSDVGTPTQAIVANRTFAAQYLGERALGQRLNLGMAKVAEAVVVGVVEDMRQGSTANGLAPTFGGVLDPPQPELFVSYRQWPFPVDDLIVAVRTSSDPAALAADVRALIRAEDPQLPVDSIMTMEDRVAASLAGPRSYAVFLVGFALCALAIAGVGLFGVLSYTTSRTREIGVRSALGARRRDVVALVGRQALTITATGVVGGLAAAFFLSQSLSTLVYGISPRDAVSFVVVPLVLVMVSIAACAAPAWRATRIDPLVALRTE